MKKIISLILLLVFSTSFSEPTNLENYKDQLIRYYDSGEYSRSLQASMDTAKNYLEETIQNNKYNYQKHPLAIVLDIDETSLSNFSHMKACKFCNCPHQIYQAIAKADDPAIQSTLELYRYAKQHHIAVFFVTGRNEALRQSTIVNLQRAGYRDWNGLYLKPRNYHHPSIIPYKSAIRQDIERMGYIITLNIGDQWSDLSGGHAEKNVKLPNPFYFLP